MNHLKPEQLWFASKNKQGATDLYPASAFDFVQDLERDEIEKYYRAGRFGGKPSISYIPATTI